MDNMYCKIRVIHSERIELLLFKYQKNNINNKIYPLSISALDSVNLLLLISICRLYKKLSFTHLVYIGQEISKAELCLYINQIYIQE